MAVVMAFFYTSDVAKLAIPLNNSEPLNKVMRTVHAIAARGRLDSYQLMRLNYHKPPTPISHRYHLQP